MEMSDYEQRENMNLKVKLNGSHTSLLSTQQTGVALHPPLPPPMTVMGEQERPLGKQSVNDHLATVIRHTQGR